jgi:hypothetical protein
MHPAIAELRTEGLESRTLLPDPSEVEELCGVYGRRPFIQWLGIYWPARENNGWIALFMLCSLAMAARTILRRREANG